MPVVKIWGVPTNETQDRLKEITFDVIFGIVYIRELKLTKDDISVFFPKDLLEDGLGEEIIVEITGLFDKPERTDEVRQCLAKLVCRILKLAFPESKVECFVFPFNESQGFWAC